MNLKQVAYLTSSHVAKDDRIYYHIKPTLETQQYHVAICSSYAHSSTISESVYTVDGNQLSKKAKINWFYERLQQLQPSLIICAEPLPIIAAKKFRKTQKCKIIYDVTEWYPSKKNVQGLSLVKKIIKGTVLFGYNLYASSFVDAFMVGEHYKQRLYDVFFPKKPKERISYYAKREYLSLKTKTLTSNQFVIGYSGKFSQEKGIHRVFKIADGVRIKNPEKHIKLKLIGKTYTDCEAQVFKQLINQYPLLTVEIVPWVPFEDFTKAISDFNIAIDLREDDWENTRCLPIKVFHYNGCGIPVIYSNLKALRKEYVATDFCKLIAPNDLDIAIDHIQKMIEDTLFYKQVSAEAVTIIQERFLWEHIQEKLIAFLQSI